MHEYVLCYAKNRQIFLQQENVFTRKKHNAIEILNKAKSIFNKLKGKNNLEAINVEFNSWIKNQPFSGGEKAYRFIDKTGRVYRPVSMAWPNKEEAPIFRSRWGK